MSAQKMFEEIRSHGRIEYIDASNGPNDFAVVHSLMFGLEDNSRLTVRFTANIDATLYFDPTCDCSGSVEEEDERFEGVEFDAIITQVRKLSGWKLFEIVFSFTELPDEGEFIGVYNAAGRTGTFSPLEEEEED